MLSLRKPDDRRLETIRDACRDLPPSYREVGCTRGISPSGYWVDRYRMQLGTGEAAYARARQALRNWDMLRLGWIGPCWPDQPWAEGALVGTLARVCGLWFVNACRIMYLVEDSAAGVERYGFAWGTLPGHVERGEERFLVKWDRSDDSVWYEILAVSRPGLLLTRIAGPVARLLQRRFASDSMQAMLRAVA